MAKCGCSAFAGHVDSKHQGLLRRTASEREDSDDLYINCLYCKFFCGYDFHMKLHMIQAHYKESERGLAAFVCKECGTKFVSRKSLVVHLANYCNSRELAGVVEGDKYRCEKCGETFRKKVELKKHMTTKHKPVVREIELCPECGRQVKRESLANHRATQHGIGEVFYHQCSACPMRFRGKYTYLRHLAKEHGMGEMAHQINPKREANNGFTSANVSQDSEVLLTIIQNVESE